jgi:gamma-glutamylcyclotransferase (GGCT)/AIG2-like uncharacterized protein YtfP
MCLIINNPKCLELDYEILDAALWGNPDGFGIFYHDTGDIVRTLDYDAIDALIDCGRPYTCHFRYATSGPVGVKQCHPFRIDSTYSLMMNGTIERLVSKNKVDTQALCELLKGLPEKQILGLLRTYAIKFALLNRVTGEVICVNKDLWLHRNGIDFSNGNCLPARSHTVQERGGASKSVHNLTDQEWEEWASYQDPVCLSAVPKKQTIPYSYDDLDEDPFCSNALLHDELPAEDPDGFTEEEWQELERETEAEMAALEASDEVASTGPKGRHVLAVYGTLKRGFCNDRYLSGAMLIGYAKTVDKYEMVDRGIPFVFDKAGVGLRLHVEIYMVNTDELLHIDGLEGHPNWYKRSKVKCELDTGGTVNAWMYMVPADNPRNTDPRRKDEPIINKFQHHYLPTPSVVKNLKSKVIGMIKKH